MVYLLEEEGTGMCDFATTQSAATVEKKWQIMDEWRHLGRMDEQKI